MSCSTRSLVTQLQPRVSEKNPQVGAFQISLISLKTALFGA